MTEPLLDFETVAARAGIGVRVGDTISTIPPIDASTTFTADSIEEVHKALAPDGQGFAYARNANPTVVSLEQVVAQLEGAEDAVAFGSGMSGIHATVLGFGLRPDERIVASSDLYGMTRSLLGQLEEFGIVVEYVNIVEPEDVERALASRSTRVLYFETISNPLLRVADVETLVELGHRYGANVVLDNTFATPCLLRPLGLGIDAVLHSATKYLAGHGDTVAGVVASNSRHTERIRSVRTMNGSILSPFEAWLTLRGIRTLPLRIERQSHTAREVADWLAAQRWVRRVYYPGLPDHPQHALAGRQFGGRFGGMVAFDLDADQVATLRFIDSLRLITPGTSLGDVESLVLYPPLSSHRMFGAEQLREIGIGEGLVRLSVGLESARDLTADLQQAAEEAKFGKVAATSQRSAL